MNDTKVLTSEFETVPNHASPHTLVQGQLRELPVANMDNLGPAGSMSSNVRDMTHWLMAQMDNGNLFGEQRLPKNSIRNIKRPAYILGIDTRDGQATHFNVYGLGIGINDRKGKLVYSHLGGVDGFLSTVMMVPEENLGIVVLTNTDKNNFFVNLAEEIRDAFLGLPYQDFSKKALKQFRRGNRKAL